MIIFGVGDNYFNIYLPFVLFKIFFNIYSFLRDRVRVREGQRERETQNPKQPPGSSCQHRARRGARTHGR